MGSTIGSTVPGRFSGRVRVRSAGSLLSGLIVVIGLVLVACGDGQVPTAEESAPGFSNRQREVTDDPFEIARPTTTSGPTTIPGPGPTLFLPDGVVRQVTSTTAVASQVPTTSTTTISLPSPDPEQPACVVLARFAGLFELVSSPPAAGQAVGAEVISSEIRSVVEVLEASSNPIYAPAIILLRGVAISVSQQTTYDGLRAVLAPLAAGTDPADAAALQPVVDEAQVRCPAIAAGVTSGRPVT